MVTVAKTSLLNDLESQREPELTEARAIQCGNAATGTDANGGCNDLL
jgi:hypothetical protein